MLANYLAKYQTHSKYNTYAKRTTLENSKGIGTIDLFLRVDLEEAVPVLSILQYLGQS